MKEAYGEAVAEALREVPGGTFEIRRHSAPEDGGAFPVEHLTTRTQGKGKIEIFPVFSGIELSVHRYLADRVRFHHEAVDSILEIDHCRSGRIGWNMRGGAAVYLGTGDLCLHSMDSCADSEMTLPLGYYEGVAVAADLRVLREHRPDILREAGFDAGEIYRKFCAGGVPTGVPACRETDAIFSCLYGLREALRPAYYKLKALEALLYVQQLEPSADRELTQYGSQQTELIKEIRDFLVDHLDRRFTIEELSRKYLINTSSLKSVFKAVYGMPIASYVKEYRMQQAMKLLRETDDSVAVIAEKVGYETQGKFAKAFKESVQVLPTEYRRLYPKG